MATAAYLFALASIGIVVAAVVDNWIHNQVVAGLIGALIVAVAGVLVRSPSDRESAE